MQRHAHGAKEPPPARALWRPVVAATADTHPPACARQAFKIKTGPGKASPSTSFSLFEYAHARATCHEAVASLVCYTTHTCAPIRGKPPGMYAGYTRNVCRIHQDLCRVHQGCMQDTPDCRVLWRFSTSPLHSRFLAHSLKWISARQC